MTIQRYIWMLSEFGQVAELPAGTCPVDALATGPLYERLLRSQPPVKLLYTHAQGSNVNDVATVLAGHTINGDACLVAACSSLAAHPTSHAALLSALLDDLLPSPTNTQHPQPQPQPHVHRRRLIRTLFAGALDSTSTPPVEAQVSCPVSLQDSDSRDQLPAQPSHPSHPSPRYLPGGTSSGLHPQYAAMRAILGSKNATPTSTASAAAVATGLTASSDALCTMASAAEEEGEGEEQEQEGIDTGAEGGCDSLKLHNNDMDMSEGGQVNIDKGVDAKEYLYERATYESESDSGSSGVGMVPQPPSDPRNRLRPDSGVASPRCKSARSEGGGDTSTAAAAVGALWPEAMMAEVEAGREMETKMEGAQGMWIEPEASGEGQMQLQEAQEQCAAVQVLEVLAAAQWAELAADVVASIALHLPQRASQLLAMSAACRGWRAALLDHRPLLARITFNLDLTPPHCQAEGAGGGTSAARRPSLTAQLPDLGNPTSLGAPPEMKTAAATGSGVVAAAVARQYTAGAWLLPSQAAGMRVPQEVEETGGRGGSWSGWGTQRDGGGAAGLSLTSNLRAVWTSPPRLLWAAAAAPNPSAQLVLAQLLEVSGDLGGALRWWRKLAVGGDVMGMFKTGMASYEGSHGAPCDPETAHLWLSRTVRQLLRVDSLSAIPETASRFTAAAVPAHHQHLAAAAGGAGEAAAERLPAAVRVSTSLAALIAALDAPRVHMLGWSAMVLGYLEFDGVAGRSLWGFGERSEAVRLFRLAEGCGLAEAGAVLGWLYNTGQY